MGLCYDCEQWILEYFSWLQIEMGAIQHWLCGAAPHKYRDCENQLLNGNCLGILLLSIVSWGDNGSDDDGKNVLSYYSWSSHNNGIDKSL